MYPTLEVVDPKFEVGGSKTIGVEAKTWRNPLNLTLVPPAVPVAPVVCDCVDGWLH